MNNPATIPSTEDQKQAVPSGGTQPAMETPMQFVTYPVRLPIELFNQLVNLAGSANIDVSSLCLQLIQKAVNSEMLSSGTITDVSEEAQEILKGLSYEAVLDALKIYNVAKMPVQDNRESDAPALPGIIAFNSTPEISDLIKQINDRRIVKGLAPLEKSLCEILYHYGINLGDYQILEDVTGLKLSTFKATVKTLALNERDANGAKSNIIDTGSLFNKFNIVDTAPQMAPPPALDDATPRNSK